MQGQCGHVWFTPPLAAFFHFLFKLHPSEGINHKREGTGEEYTTAANAFSADLSDFWMTRSEWEVGYSISEKQFNFTLRSVLSLYFVKGIFLNGSKLTVYVCGWFKWSACHISLEAHGSKSNYYICVVFDTCLPLGASGLLLNWKSCQQLLVKNYS